MAKTKVYFEQTSLQGVLEKLLDEAACFVANNARWWDDAAEHVVNAARNCDKLEKSKWQLVGACFQERAQLHRELAERLGVQSDSASIDAR